MAHRRRYGDGDAGKPADHRPAHNRSFKNRINRGATKPEWLPGSSIGSLSQ
jgi:hypothetical protein